MQKYISFFLLFALSGCSLVSQTTKSDKYQMEITLHKTRADLEEIKHDLHTQKIELSILEGKMVNHEDQMTSLKSDTFDLHKTKLEGCHGQIIHLEKKLSLLDSKIEEISLQLQKVTTLTQEMTKALAQSKEKLNEFERTFATQASSLKTLDFRSSKNPE